MLRIGLVLCVFGPLVIGGTAQAQCRGGGGGGGQTAAAGTAATGATTGATTGVALLRGAGSFASDVMLAQAIQQRLAQQQYLLAMQRQEQRQQDLLARRERAEKTRAQIAQNRERTRAYLAAKDGKPSAATAPASLLAAADTYRR